MLERLLKLRLFVRDIAEQDAFRGRLTIYTANQWELVAGLITILSPIRNLTKFTQEAPPRPGFGLFEIARYKSEVMEEEVRGLCTLQGELIASYTDRLAQYINSKPYIIARLLDINVKGCVFNREQRALKWEMLTVAVAQHITNTRPDVPAPGIADNVIGLAR